MNNIIVVSGPSGCGKSTLIGRLLEEFPAARFSISHTTRTRRDGEQDGKDYHFVTEKKFLEMIAAGEFVEHAHVHQYYYGTSLAEIRSKSQDRVNLLLDIDVQGAVKIKKEIPEALSVLIVPPDLEELKKRLELRENGLNDQVKKRLEMARDEMSHYSTYDYIVINDRLEEAYEALRSIYIAFNHRVAKQEAFIKQLLGR